MRLSRLGFHEGLVCGDLANLSLQTKVSAGAERRVGTDLGTL